MDSGKLTEVIFRLLLPAEIVVLPV